MAVEAAMESGMPPAAFYSLPYLLPQFCRKMEISRQGAVCIQYGEHAWLVEGRKVSPCFGSGVKYVLAETDVARLFFAPESGRVRNTPENAEMLSPSEELARYVNQANVEPKSSSGTALGEGKFSDVQVSPDGEFSDDRSTAEREGRFSTALRWCRVWRPRLPGARSEHYGRPYC